MQGTWRTCPRCAAAVEPGQRACSACGLIMSEPVTGQAQRQPPMLSASPARSAAPDGEYDVIRLTMALVAAGLFAYAGVQMVGLRSVGGESVAEYFYQAVGWMSFGLAALSIAVGLRRG